MCTVERPCLLDAKFEHEWLGHSIKTTGCLAPFVYMKGAKAGRDALQHNSRDVKGLLMSDSWGSVISIAVWTQGHRGQAVGCPVHFCLAGCACIKAIEMEHGAVRYYSLVVTPVRMPGPARPSGPDSVHFCFACFVFIKGVKGEHDAVHNYSLVVTWLLMPATARPSGPDKANFCVACCHFKAAVHTYSMDVEAMLVPATARP